MSCVKDAKVIGERAQFFVAVAGDPEIVFQSKAAASGPVDTRLNGQHHTLTNRTLSGLMSVWRLVGASSHTVTYGVRRLAGISAFGYARPNQAVKVRQAGAVFGEGRSFVKDAQQQVEQLVVLRR
jgi:hypothetical protein